MRHSRRRTRPSPGVVCFAAKKGAPHLWFRELESAEEEPVLSIDSEKVYVARGTVVTVLDLATGRELGRAVVPGLDEAIGWRVRQGAFLVAEENRVSVYELPD